MKAYITIVCMIIYSYACSQVRYLSLPDSYLANDSIIFEIINEYDSINYKSLVYRPSEELSPFCSVLIINYDNKTKYWCIKDNTICKNGYLTSDSIFMYKKYLYTGARDYEKRISGFTPPLMCQGVETESVVYRDKTISFYFEYGKNVCTYVEDQKFVNLRKKWLEVIRNDLKFVFTN